MAGNSWLDDYKNRVAFMPDAAQAAAKIELPTERDREHLFKLGPGVWLPVAQSAVTGLFFGAAFGALAWLAGAAEPWRWFLGVALIIPPLLWVGLLMSWLKLTAPLERLIQYDLNRDGYIGEPAEPEIIKIEINSENGRRTQFIDLPNYPGMQALAAGVLAGKSLSFSEWTGIDRPFSRGQFEHIQDILITRELATWRQPTEHRLGVTLTKSGSEVFKALANRPPTPGF